MVAVQMSKIEIRIIYIYLQLVKTFSYGFLTLGSVKSGIYYEVSFIGFNNETIKVLQRIIR